MNIVIPTYPKHYNYNVNFLTSFEKFCLDKEEVTINFIVTTLTYKHFLKIKKIFPKLHINIVTLNDLILNVDGLYYDNVEKLFPIKYSLQSLKKLFSYTIVEGDYIVFDSENLCIKPFYFKDVFKGLKDKPILYSNSYPMDLQKEVVNNSNKLLNFNSSKWFFLKSYWFFEGEYVKMLINEIRSLPQTNITLIFKSGVFFEYQLYATFLYKNNLKKFICIDEVINDEYPFSDDIKKRNQTYEYINLILNKENISYYTNIINDLNESIVRLHWVSDDIKNIIINDTKACIGTFHWD